MTATEMGKVIAIVSGGLDSVTMLYDLKAGNFDVDVISFNYGQRHMKELAYAKAAAMTLGFKHDIVDLTDLTHLISNSALTNRETSDGDRIMFYRNNELGKGKVERKIEVPEGHYAEENMKLTVVPNRNMIMFAIAGGIAVNRNARWIAAAQHAGDHFIYPDCRPRFIAATSAAIAMGNMGFGAFPEVPDNELPQQVILAPFLHWTKADIAVRALELGVPLHLTWSCYKGGERHCGRCGTCVERLEAIDEARTRIINGGGKLAATATDHTDYEDTEYWRLAVRKSRETANG